MSHFAKIENGKVVEVIVAEQDHINTLSGKWVQTSYNTYRNQHTAGGTALRGNYAGIGHTYDEAHDVFYEPQPHPSWTLNHTTWIWEAPTPRPDDGKDYRWDEPTQAWVE